MDDILELLVENSTRLIVTCESEYKRYFAKSIDFEQKMIGIIGARGVGKTTAILQHLKALELPFSQKLYLSVDMIEIADMSLFEIAKLFELYGGKVLAIDEIHKSKNFEVELKNIYDRLKLHVIFSGSSALKLEHSKADLSRRGTMYHVQGLSYREFLEMKLGISLPSYSLDEIVKNHTEISASLLGAFKPLEHFGEYLRVGYYPFYFDDKRRYLDKLETIINTVIEIDLPSIFSLKYENTANLKKLVKMLCYSEPYTINISELSKKIGIQRDRLYLYIDYLWRGSIFLPLRAKSKGDGIFVKPAKLYLHNANLYHSYCKNAKKGTIREAFFANTVGQEHEILHTKVGDFWVDKCYIFEIGGKNKSYKQIKDVENSYVVADDMEVGFGNKIPLWLFGFLY
jgi:predicted AAA+ superfamily ATPase